jgi:hypothetical protein
MNYRPVICFREIRNHEKDLMRNAESILKELGFHIKTTSPHLDDRKWELEFSEDFAKEIYIEFQDDADELHSPTVIIDNILTDQLQTIDGSSGYYEETVIDGAALKDIIENESSNILSELIPNISEDEINSLKNKLKNNTDVLLSEMFDMSNHNVSIKSKTQDTNLENHINEIYSNSTPLSSGTSRESLIQDLKELDPEDDEVGNHIVDLLLNYMGDGELTNEIYDIIYQDEDEDDEDDDDDENEDEDDDFS